jgi:hypothetical protein
MAGDGDFLMNGQELATAAQHGAKSIIVLLNNGMYGTIRMHQERDYPQHGVRRHAARQPGLRRAGEGLRLRRRITRASRAPQRGSSSRRCWPRWSASRAR